MRLPAFLVAVLGLVLGISAVTQAPAIASMRAAAVTSGTVGGLGVALSASVAGASGVTYTVEFTASPTGALVAGQSDITLALPAGSAYTGGLSNPIAFDDLTSGQSDSYGYQQSGSTFTNYVPVNVAAGDTVKVTLTGITSTATAGPQTLSFSTSSDATPATASFSLTAAQPVASLSDATLSTSAAGASGVTYSFEFTASSTGALVADHGGITLTLPAGTSYAGGIASPITFDDLTSGQSSSYGYQQSGSTFTNDVPVNVAPGDKVKVTLTGITNTATPGTQTFSLTTSTDTRPVTASLALTAGDQPVSSLSDATLSTSAAGASGVTYSFEFTASPTGALVADHAGITLTLPAGSAYDGSRNPIIFDDLTSGQSSSYGYLQSGSTFTNYVPVNVAAGDTVKVTVPGVTSVATTGAQALSFSTTSDTRPVTAGFSLTPPGSVAAPGLTVSSQAPGGTATYTATLTTSPGGPLVPGGGVILAGPAGTVFSPSGSYTIEDITSQRTGAMSPAVSNDGATVTLTTPIAVAGGDQVTITATGVTNPTTTSGQFTAGLSTTSDTVPVPTSPSYFIGDSTPLFTAATPPLAVAPGSSQQYTFVTSGYPAAAYSLSGAPSWLAINEVTGQLSGKVPAGTTSFTYSVQAANSVGTATEGPYTVTVSAHTATISGQVLDTSGDPVAAVAVDACDPAGGSCASATTGDTGVFSLDAVVGSTVVLTAWPPPGSGVTTVSTGPLAVPAAGLSGEKLTVPAGIPPLQGTLLINGSSAPVVYWATPATATLTGCADGLATVTAIGQNISTGQYTSDVIVLTETPAGSGFYTGTIPPQEPVHGPVEIRSSLLCPSSSPIQPDAGPASGGSTVIIGGSGFTNVTSVSFGGRPAVSYTVLSDQGIQAVVPPGSGTVPVTVALGGSSAPVTVGQFAYQAVQSISPNHGAPAGGTWVILKGEGLLTASRVFFGTMAAPDYVVLSDTELEALSPSGTGTVDITVQTDDGTTGATAANRFTYGTAAAASAPRTAQTAVQSPPRPLGPAQPMRPATSVVGLVTQAIYKFGANVISYGGGVSTLITNISQLVSGKHLSCTESEQQATEDVMVALEPAIAALADDLAPIVIRAMIPYFLALGIGGWAVGAVIAALTPTILSLLLDKLAKQLVSAAVKAYWDSQYGKNCGNPLPPPPPPLTPPPLPPEGSDQLCSYNCGFSPTGRIDPSGTVVDTNGHPVSGATVTILHSYTRNGAYLPVSSSSPLISPAVNPEVTTSDGAFHWEVFPGYYKVEASAPGCTVPGSAATTAVIGPYPVPPPQLGLIITLQCSGEEPPSAPAVTGLSQAAGPPGGGTVISVLGTNFTPASKVAFAAAPAKSVTYLSPQALMVTAPKGSGLADVHVTTAGGTSAAVAADQFFFGSAPTVTKVSPATGPASGGTTVTITGTNFTGTTAVSFGGTPAQKFTVRSSTTIVAAIGARGAGTADVQVANPAGSSALSGAATFNYLAPVTAYVATSAGIVPVVEGAAKAGPVIKVTGAAGVAATPDGDTLLVAGSKGATEISTASGQAGGTVPTGKTSRTVAVTPGGTVAYVLNYGSKSVTPITIATGLAGKAIPVGSEPDAIAITANGKTAYVANYGSGTVTPITIATGKAGTPVKVGTRPDAIAITPNGKTAYVANSGSGSVTPITIATGKAGKAIAVGHGPDAIAISPNGLTAYVVNSASGSVTPITIATGKAAKAVPVGKNPDAIVITPNGKTAYVLNGGSGSVTPITVATRKTGKVIPVGKDPLAAAVTPNGATVYVLNHGSGTVTPVTVATGKASKAITVGPAPVTVTITR